MSRVRELQRRVEKLAGGSDLVWSCGVLVMDAEGTPTTKQNVFFIRMLRPRSEVLDDDFLCSEHEDPDTWACKRKLVLFRRRVLNGEVE